MKPFRSRRWGLALVLLVVLGLGGAGYIAIGSAFMAPDHRAVGPAPDSLGAETLRLPSPSGATLTAWLIVPESPRGVVLVLHGIHANRGFMLGRAELFRRDGFAVLVPDFQAHGESTGERITFGFLEAHDVEACVAYARRRFPDLPLGGVGVSMGGAALTLAARRAPVDAAVLEAAFPSITEAVDNRLAARFGSPLSRLLTPALLLQLKPRLGFGPDDLRPIEAVQSMTSPLLIISGTADRSTTEAQTRSLYAAAPEPKELWLVPGAGHVDLLRFDPDGYRTHVLGFLRKQLRAK